MIHVIDRWMRAVARGVFGLALVVPLTVAVTSANGQMRDASVLLNLSQPDFLHRDMPVFSQELELDDGQRMILDSLYEDYRNAFESGWSSTQQNLQDSMKEQRDEMTREHAANLVAGPLEDWQRAKLRLEEQFKRDVQAILNEQQRQQWPAFERRLVREKSMHYGRLSGESVDLIRIVRLLDLSPRTKRAIEPELEAYSVALDEALRARNEMLHEQSADLFHSLRQSDISEDYVRKAEREVQLRTRVRDINDRHIEDIAASLPQEQGTKFKLEALVSAYPQAYRPIPAQTTYERAMEIEDLEDEILSTIKDLYSIFMTELEVVNREIHQAVKRHEPNVMIYEAKEAAAHAKNEQVERPVSPLRALVKDREDRANYYISLLREFLTEEQFASIPGTQRWRYANRRAEAQRRGSRRGLSERPPDRAKDAGQRSMEQRQRDQRQRQQSGGEER